MQNFALHVADHRAAWTVRRKFLARDVDDSGDPCPAIPDFVSQSGRKFAKSKRCASRWRTSGCPRQKTGRTADTIRHTEMTILQGCVSSLLK